MSRFERPRLRALARPLLGLLVLALLAWQLDTRRILGLLAQASLAEVVLAWLASFLAMFTCVWRWKRIALALALLPKGLAQAAAPTFRWMSLLYIRAMALNSLLPGGVLGGDVYRALELARPTGQRLKASLSVLLDRAGGLWALAVLALLAAGVEVLMRGAVGPVEVWSAAPGEAALRSALALYVAGLVAIALSPLFSPLLIRLAGTRLPERLISLLRHLPLLVKAWRTSLASQSLYLLALWLCFQAVGLPMGLLLTAVVGCAIFLMGMMPAAMGGFGAREVGALAILSPLLAAALGGLPDGMAETIVAASLLYGLMATGIGLLGALAWLLPLHAPCPPPPDKV